MNNITILGRTIKEVQLMRGNKMNFTSNTIACDSALKGQTTFINIKIFGKLAEQVFCKYVRKGDLVYVSGQLTSETYTGTDGKAKTSYVVYVDKVKLIGSRNAVEETPSDFRRPTNNSPVTTTEDDFPIDFPL